MSESNKRKGLWSSTLNKLKSALSKTKSVIADDASDIVISEEQAASAPAGIEREKNFESGSESIAIRASQSPESEMLGTGQNLIKTYSPEKKTFWQAFVQSKSDNASSEPPAAVSSSKQPETSEISTVDVDYLEDLEEKLIKADIGVNNVEELLKNLRSQSKGQNWTTRNVHDFLKREFLSILKSAPDSRIEFQPGKLNIYLVVGVNGTGKTTSIGKLSWKFKAQGRKVLMAAGDTFRAAAESQLEIWSKRAGVDIVRLDDGADPGAVVYKALEEARAGQYDCLVIDTAGRLHNKSNLMDELKKIRSVIEKRASDCPLESLLVLDASTGQNGIQQAKVFTEACSLTGVILTKLDGTAKGGVVLSIARDLNIPVKLIGLGEQMDDLKDFDPDMFIEALF